MSKEKIRFRFEGSSTVLDALRDRGWMQVEGEDESWDLFWCEVTQLKTCLDQLRLRNNQRIPHFRNHYELSRKSYLARNMKKYRKQMLREGRLQEAELCDCIPITFELPNDYRMFVEEYKKHAGATWIVKPVCGSQGRGIFLFQKLKELIEWKNRELGKDPPSMASKMNLDTDAAYVDVYIVQKYVENPYLIAGRKFDIRIYVLVTSFTPLRVWLARDGFARLSGAQFSLDAIGDARVHLTNVAVQMAASEEDGQVFKWSLRRLRQHLTAKHGLCAVERLMERIAETVVASLRSVQKVIIQDRHCFELYGYDILLDTDLKPWLLEANASPAMAATDKEDYDRKHDLIEDVLNILDMEGRLTGKETRVGGFDLLHDDGPVYMKGWGCGEALPKGTKMPLNAFLGCHNDRGIQLQELWERIGQVKKVEESLKADEPKKGNKDAGEKIKTDLSA